MSMEKAFIAGVGMTHFKKEPTRSIEDLGVEAVLAAIADSEINRIDIGEVFCGSSYGGPLIGQRILREVGLTRMPITNIENACSSGSAALREACAAITVGRAQTVLVIGIDKLTKLGSRTLPLEMTDTEVSLGMVMPALYAIRAKRYMHETGATVTHLAKVAVKARRYGALNPHAQFQRAVTVEDVLESRKIADPLTLFMCCPTGDGAAALIVTTRKKLRASRPVEIAASVLQSGEYKPGFRDMTTSELTQRTSQLAYAMAGVGPKDIDLAEVHDAFAIAELMYYEALGFCGRGEGKDLIDRGDTDIGGRIPVNPSGGLLSKGHPVGATGIAQIVEAVSQLRGQAGARQVMGAKVALTHCTGGGIAGLDHGACAIHILKS